MDRFETFAKLLTSKGTPRSLPYRQGLAAKLRCKVQGDPIPCPYSAGTPEFDAYYAGVDHGGFFLECIKYGDHPDIELLDSWQALNDLEECTKLPAA